MSNQIVISSGAKVRNLDGVLTGSTGIVGSVPLGAANGVATLDALGKVPLSQLPASVVTYLGTWNAATNTPTLANGTGDTGDLYICNVAGTVNFGAGPITFSVGDWVIYSGTTWERSAGSTGTVTSVAVTESGDALSITGSPITTAGTINIGFAGTSGQYINGAGGLTTFPSLTGFVPYTGATANVDLGTFDLTADVITGATGSFASSGGSDTFAINHSSGSGIALNITKGGNGEGLYINKTSGSGNAATINGDVQINSGTLTGTSIILSQDLYLENNKYIYAKKSTGATSYNIIGINLSDQVSIDASGLGAVFGGSIRGTSIYSEGALSGAGEIHLKQNVAFTNPTGYSTISGITNGFLLFASGKSVTLSNVNITTPRTISFPDAAGTIALTSNLSSYVPYTGATGAVNLGAYDLTVNSVKVGRGGGSISTNTALGTSSLNSNTTGSSNTALGYATLFTNTIGTQNSALGNSALYFNTSGSNNTAIGNVVLQQNTTGDNNTAIGSFASYQNTTGSNNTSLGAGALSANTTGEGNTAIGGSSLYSNTTSFYNTAIGFSSLNLNTTGQSNVAVGVSSLGANTTGQYNVAVGRNASNSNTTGNYNTALGSQALSNVTTGSQNIAIGYNSGNGITTGSQNTIIGYVVGLSSSLSNNIILADGGGNIRYQWDGTTNLFTSKLTVNTGGIDNQIALIGTAPSVRLANAVTGATINGFIAMAGSTNDYITGAVAGDMCIGNQNSGKIIYGFGSGTATAFMTITSTGLGIGTSSPSSRLSVFEPTGGTTSTAEFATQGNAYKGRFGMFANNFYITSNWFYNGSQNADSLSYGQGSITFGGGGTIDFQTSAAGATSPSTRMIITSGGYVKASNNGTYINGATSTFHSLEQSGTTDVALYAYNSYVGNGNVILARGYSNNTSGSLFLGYSSSLGDYTIRIFSNGNIQNTNNSYGSLSDIKLKENIIDSSSKLEDLLKVRIVNYNLIGHETKQIGVIAQELEQIFPSMIEEVADTDEMGNDLGTTTKSVKYSVFVPMLIKAIQEQQAQIDELKALINK